MESNAVEVRDLLVLDRTDRPLLQVPEFTLPRGEVCGLYGASAQVTTLFLNCVAGVRVPDAGSVSAFGVAVSPYVSAGHALGVLTRDGSLFTDYSVATNLSLALRFSLPGWRFRGARATHMTRIATVLALEPWLRVPVKRLTPGVRQCLRLACALAHDPRLLVADDPWGQADQESRGVIQRALRDHCDRGNTLLFTSPREEEIVEFASEVCLFNQTTLIARGTLDHLRRYLDSQETVFVRVQSQASLLVSQFLGLPGVLRCDHTANTVRILAKPGSVRLTRLAEYVQDLGLELLDIHIEKPGLGEIYATVVGETGPA